MAVRVAINGFGRIGRNVLRAIMESGRKDIEVVAINDLGPVETNAHLLRFDSVHGRFPGTVTVDGDTIDIGSGKIKVCAVKDPTALPWKDLGVDVVFESTGIFANNLHGDFCWGQQGKAVFGKCRSWPYLASVGNRGLTSIA